MDVWPINFFDPASATTIDNCWLFMMQLACILNMVDGWKKRTQLRVFMCVDSQVDSQSKRQLQWENMLRMLRINASISVVLWDHITFQVTPVMVETEADRQWFPGVEYLRGVNGMIQQHSTKTAVTFIYLPPPPADVSENVTYLEKLDMLTVNLPPTLLVHGISPVTSTTL